MRSSVGKMMVIAPAALAVVVACGSSDDAASNKDIGAPAPPLPGTDPGGAPPGASGTCPHDLSALPGMATNGLTIPTGHPRLWWTPARLARAKTWVASHPQAPADDDYLGQVFLHAVTGADCSKAITWAMGFTVGDDEFRVASDQVRWSGEEAAMVYDWCFDQLKSDERQTLVDRWSGYVNRAAALTWGGPQMPENNYYWGYLRNEIDWGIITQQESPDATKLLEHGLVTRWKESFLPFAQGTANGDGRGGIPQEGAQYGSDMANYPITPFVTASLHGRSVYDETDFFKSTVFYVIYATTPGATKSGVDGGSGYEMFPYNDDESWENHNSSSNFADFMAQAGMNWGCLPVGKYARQWSKLTSATPTPYIASVDEGGDTLDFGMLPLDYYAPGPRYLYGRNAWGATSTAFHWQLGDYSTSGVGHSHYDYGNWQVWRAGRWLSRESVGYSDIYTGFGGTGTASSGDTIAHNTLLVNGFGLAEPSDTDPPPVVRRMESQADYAYADVDLSTAYRNSDTNHPDRDNPAASHVERELLFLRGLETTIIFDRVESRATGGLAAEAIAKTFLAHFEQAPVVTDARHITYTIDGQALALTILAPAAPTTRVIDEKSAKNDKLGQFRLEVSTSGTAQSYFLTVLQAKDAGAPALVPTAAETDAQFTVTLDATTSVVFMKGRASTGGSVTVRGETKTLRSDAQATKVTDAAPVWQ